MTSQPEEINKNNNEISQIPANSNINKSENSENSEKSKKDKDNEVLSDEGDEILSDSESDKEPEVVENIKLNKINTIYEMELPEDSLLNSDFLYNYCVDLIKSNQYDPKVITWMIENKEKLFKEGLTDQMIKWILKKDKYYKANNIINSMTYRLAKFGRLAPKSDLVRKLNDEDNEENFKFYEEDSFLEVEDEEENHRNDYCMIKDVSGFFSEERICYMIKKRRKERKERKEKNHQKTKNKMKFKEKILGNKRKIENSNEESVFSSMKENNQSKENGIRIYTSLKELLSEYMSRQDEIKENKKQKLLLIRSIIYNQRRKIRPSDKEKFFNFEITTEEISSFINEDLSITDLLIAFEIRKYNKESKWSTIYKGIHKFIKDNNNKEKHEEKNENNDNQNENDNDNNKSSFNNIKEDIVNSTSKVKLLNEDKFKEKIMGFYRKIQEFKVIYEDLNRLTSSNSEILKKYMNGTVDARDPIKFAKTRIQICMNSLKMSILSQGKFWEVYDKLEEEDLNRKNESQIEVNDKTSQIDLNIEENEENPCSNSKIDIDTEIDNVNNQYVNIDNDKSTKRVYKKVIKPVQTSQDQLNMVINLIEESNFSMINSVINENASGISVSEGKDKGKVRKNHSLKKPLLSNYFYKKEYNENDFIIDISTN